jgi:hypothetical protein
MKHEPPVPEANRSPYPIKEAPHHPAQAGTTGVQVTAANRPAAGKDAHAPKRSDRTGETGARSKIGIGAAAALGAVAAIAAVLLTRNPAKGARGAKGDVASKSKTPGARKHDKKSA